MKKTGKKKEVKIFYTYLILSLVVLLFLFILALTVGRYSISLDKFFQIISGNTKGLATELSVLTKLRLPRSIVAVLVGIALSISGLIYQEIFQNKLVSPDILGVSSGAGVGAAFAILLGLGSFVISAFSFVFGIITVTITLILAKLFQNKSKLILVLSGIIVSGLMGSGLSLIKSIANADTTLPAITYWLLGSFSSTTIKDTLILGPIVLICVGFIWVIRWKMNVLALGKEEAESKGTDFNKYKYLIIGVATLLTAASVAISGVIGWIGLVIPHIVRIAVGRSNKYTIPLTITFGAIFMLATDILCRTISSVEIPLSAITGVLGLIIFVVILVLKKEKINEFN